MEAIHFVNLGGVAFLMFMFYYVSFTLINYFFSIEKEDIVKESMIATSVFTLIGIIILCFA